MSEAITNAKSNGKLQAFSAGSQPAGVVHPLSLKYLAESGYSTTGLASQSWDEFEAEQPDIVITVCDSAASETCPVWFGNTIKIHWGLPDPSKLQGGKEEVRQAFYQVMASIEHRVQQLLDLGLENLEPAKRETALKQLSGA